MLKEDSLFVCEGKVNYQNHSLFETLRNLTEDSEDTINKFLENVTISAYKTITVDELISLGFKRSKAVKLFNGLQLAIKLNEISVPKRFIVRSPQDGYELFKYLQYEYQEQFVVAALDTKQQVLAKEVIFKGTLNASIVHPREVFRFALKHSAASIVVAHQHPSGNPTPSSEDIDVTRRLIEAGKYIGIDLIDHIIVGHGDFISLKDRGYIK